MSQTSFSMDGPDSIEAIRTLLDSEGVQEALKAGSSLTFAWNDMLVSNPKHNHSTGATDDSGDDVLDEREEITVVMPRLEITGKTKFEEHSVVTDITREIETRDATLSGIDDTLETINDRLRNIERSVDDLDSDDGTDDFDTAVRRVGEARQRRSPVVAVIWTLVIFCLGALYGSANSVQVSTIFGRFLQLFS